MLKLVNLVKHYHSRKTPSRRVDSVPFQVRVWNGKNHETVSLYVHCGPGDKAEPVLTIMLEGEA